MSLQLRWFLLGAVATLGPSVAILALTLAAAWYRERHGRKRALRALLLDVRRDFVGR